MPDRCGSCGRSLAAMRVHRRRGETFRPGSIMPSTPVHARGRATLCGECFRTLPPKLKRDYVEDAAPQRFGSP